EEENEQQEVEGDNLTPFTPSSSNQPQMYRSISDIYNATERMNGDNLFSLFMNDEPLSFEEAIKEKKWKQAMEEEIHSIEKNDTWEIATLPSGHEAIGEVFAPVARLETIWLLIALAAQNRWPIHQMDVKSAFFNSTLEEVYVNQPEGFSINSHENKVLKLKKALYGLKQAPRAWYNHLDNYLQMNGFSRYLHEYALYVKKDKGDILCICIYVDDLILTGSNPHMYGTFKKVMAQEFEMSDMRLMSYYLGLEVKQQSNGIFISQEAYAREILKKFKMMECNPVTTPIEYGVKLSKDDGGKKSQLNYISKSCCDVNDLRSTIRFVFYFGENKISWCLRKQPIVTLLTCESEYVATTAGTCHAIWLRRLLRERYFAQDGATKIMVDKKSAIALAKNPVFHDRSKHIDARFYFIRDCIANKEIEVEYVKTLDQVADIFIKALKKDRLQQLREIIGVVKKSSLQGDVENSKG
ncbi:UNVERIFIED_CONTAM: Retrovirus-related Pol polyprotein from transposon RE1, partial [Sesamum latifolium]